MSRVIHFEIHATLPEKSMAFYKEVFGWTFKKAEGLQHDYWFITTGPSKEAGIDGGLFKRMGNPAPDGSAVNAFVCTIKVKDLSASMSKAEKAGGLMAMPKMAIPGVGWLCYFRDVDGNIFGMMEDDATAK
jgi:uncharacterized protein